VGSAKSQSLVSCRYAVEADVTVISIDYRKGPESPFPSQIHDAYAAVLAVISKAQDLGIDPAHVGVFGESAGGYVSIGVAMMLAKNDQSDKIRFHNPQTPMVTDRFTNGRKLEEGPETVMGVHLKAFYQVFVSDPDNGLEKNKDNEYLYPIKTPDEFVKKMAPAVV